MPDLDKDSRILEEFTRISVYFEELSENKKTLVYPLIQNCAFMRVTLSDLQKIIERDGPVESYQNGENQSGRKQSAALQSYNALVKNYAAVVKSLFSLLPPMERPAASRLDLIKKEAEEVTECFQSE